MPEYAKGKTTVNKNTGKVTKHSSEEEAKKAAKKSYKRKRLGH